MNIKINRIELLRSLSSIVFAAERKHHIQILTNVLIEIRENNFYLTTTDMELECRSRLTLENSYDANSFCVSAKSLHDIVRVTKVSDLILDFTKESQLIVKAGKSKFTLPMLDGIDFPRFTVKSENEKEFIFNYSVITDILKRVSFCASNNDVRQYLLGVKLELREQLITAIATDGYRLALYDVKSENLPTNTEVDVILPKKVCTELIKLNSIFSNEDLKIIINESNYINFQVGELSIISRLIDGKYPECRSLIPESHPFSVKIDREEFKNKLSETSTMLNERFRVIVMQLEKNNLQLSTNNTEVEKAEVILEVGYTADPIKIGCNLNHISEVLQAMDSTEVKISLKDSDDKILIEYPDQASPQYIVMPSRIT